MEDPIINRVAKSPIVNLDMETLYPDVSVTSLDISKWLEGGFILKEKDFRTQLEEADLGVFKDAVVALHCSTDAILPGWTFMLVASKLEAIAQLVVIGDKKTAETTFAQDFIASLDLSEYKDKPVIIKGCGDREIPDQALIALSNRLHQVAKKVMFGEACSFVPVYSRK